MTKGVGWLVWSGDGPQRDMVPRVHCSSLPTPSRPSPAQRDPLSPNVSQREVAYFPLHVLGPLPREPEKGYWPQMGQNRGDLRVST